MNVPVSKRPILIIEADPYLGDAMFRTLQDEGYKVESVRNADQALLSLHKLQPRLLVIDKELPLRCAEEMMKKKSNDPAIDLIPTIMILKNADSGEINEALALGAKDYMVSSEYTSQNFMERVKQQLDLHDIFAKKSPAPAEEKAAAVSSLAGKKIMLIEDDDFLSELIAKKVAACGGQLARHATGEGSVKRIRDEKPDLILLDVLLKTLNGYEILGQVKTDDTIKHIPVIMLSNLSQRSDIEKALQLGAVKFLVKATVTLDEIIEEIQKTLK